MVRCPSCKQIFPSDHFQTACTGRTAKDTGKISGIGIAGPILLAIGLFALQLLDTKQNDVVTTRIAPTANLAQPPVNSIQQPAYHAPRWIRANYRGLVDLNQLTQSGETISATIAEGVKDSYQRGQLQPFLDKFSSLLPQALDNCRRRSK